MTDESRRRAGAALPQLLPVAPEDLRARPARARARRDPRRLPRPRDGASRPSRRSTPGAPLPPSLTPVYPTTAQLPQPYLRKAIAASLGRAPLQEVLPPQVVPAGLPSLRAAVETLHHPPADVSLHALEDGSHPAAQRLKFEELLAQQLSQLASRAERALLRAPEIAPRAGGLHEKLLGVLPFGLTGAQRRVVDEIVADLAGPRPDAPPAAGRRRRRQDRGRRAGRGRGDGRRLAVRADGAHRDPGRAALRQARAVARAAGHRGGLAQRQPQGQGAREGARAGGQRRGPAGRRHARGDPGGRRVRAAGAGHRRRAAPLRRAAAPGAAPQAGHRGAGAAPADDDGHADPAHAGDDLLRRPGRQHHRRAAARAHAHRHARVRRHAAARDRRAHPRRDRRRAARSTGSAR